MKMRLACLLHGTISNAKMQEKMAQFTFWIQDGLHFFRKRGNKKRRKNGIENNDDQIESPASTQSRIIERKISSTRANQILGIRASSKKLLQNSTEIAFLEILSISFQLYHRNPRIWQTFSINSVS